jgi:hypothetical protein
MNDLIINRPALALEFYKKVFGATGMFRFGNGRGSVRPHVDHLDAQGRRRSRGAGGTGMPSEGSCEAPAGRGQHQQHG